MEFVIEDVLSIAAIFALLLWLLTRKRASETPPHFESMDRIADAIEARESPKGRR